MLSAQMPWEEVKNLRYVNNDNCYTQFGLLTFDELLAQVMDGTITDAKTVAATLKTKILLGL